MDIYYPRDAVVWCLVALTVTLLAGWPFGLLIAVAYFVIDEMGF